MRLIIDVLFWMVAAAILFGGTAIAVGFLTAPALGYASGVAILVLLPLIAQLNKQIRRRRAQVVLAYLEQAVRLNLPLSRMIYAAQRGERGPTSLRLAGLRQQLEEGYSLGIALQSAVPESDPRAVALLDAAERLGRLKHALTSLARERSTSQLAREPNLAGFFRAYPFMMIMAIATTASVMTIYVLPKFQQIFKDFGVKMPPITMSTFIFLRDAGAIAMIVAFASVLWWAGSLMFQIVHGEPAAAATTPSMLRELRDRLLWFLPITHGIARDRGLADAYAFIADALRAGITADRAIAEAASLKMNTVLSDRLKEWAARAADGAGLADGARAAWMPSFTVEMLAGARNAEQAADVLDFLARYHGGRFSRTQMLLQSAGVPLMTLFFAVIVAVVAISLLSPLVSLIQSMTAHSGKWRL